MPCRWSRLGFLMSRVVGVWIFSFFFRYSARERESKSEEESFFGKTNMCCVHVILIHTFFTALYLCLFFRIVVRIRVCFSLFSRFAFGLPVFFVFFILPCGFLFYFGGFARSEE